MEELIRFSHFAFDRSVRWPCCQTMVALRGLFRLIDHAGLPGRGPEYFTIG